MSQNIQGSRITGSMSLSGPVTATKFYGDGSSLTGAGGSYYDQLQGSIIPGYLVNANTSKPYRLTVPVTQYGTSTLLINGEAIYATKFFAYPGEKINEIAFRIMTAGAAGTGLSQCRILIYRTKLDANGNLVGGDLELDTGVNISTLSTGLKTVSGLNWTLSNNTYKNCWYMCIRNYQSGTLSLKGLVNTTTLTWYGELASSTTTMYRDMSWYWSCPYTSATPASMPTVSASAPSTTAVAEWSQYLAIGYSAT